ncbi:MAG: D-aminoacylase [Nitrososphaeria archaeon]
MDFKKSLLIKNGKIANGTGSSLFKANIYITDDKINEITNAQPKADRVIDADGLIVAPGFVNIHDHSDSTLLLDGRADNLVRQGITTTVTGNCGYSLAPIVDDKLDLLLKNWLFPLREIKIKWRTYQEYLSRLEESGLSINVAPLVGHGTIRINMLGIENRQPTEEELTYMRKMVSDAMEAGAFGMSSGLAYPPGCYAETEEIVELCKEVARFEGIYATHTRKESLGYLDGVVEAIKITSKSGVRTQISHIETHYPAWGEQEKALNLIETATRKGLDIGFDVIPYLWSATSLYTLLPNWACEGGPDQISHRMQDKKTREKIKEEILNSERELTTSALAKDKLWDKIKILSCPNAKEFEGKTIKEVASIEKKEPFELVFDLLSMGAPIPSIMAQSHKEEDIRMVIQNRNSTIGSDLYSIPRKHRREQGFQHPRAFGTFPLLFRKYVRGETLKTLPEEEGCKVLSLEEAVRRVTTLPAQRIKLKDRGIIEKGAFADIVIFDADKIQDTATYRNPFKNPRGVEYVIINGETVVEHGKHTNKRPGRVIRRN